MNSKLAYSLVFLGGAMVGGVVAVLGVKQKYKKLADEEIESVKDHFEALYLKHKGVSKASNTPGRTEVGGWTKDAEKIDYTQYKKPDLKSLADKARAEKVEHQLTTQPDAPTDDPPEDEGAYDYEHEPEETEHYPEDDIPETSVEATMPQAEIRSRQITMINKPFYITDEEFIHEFPEHSKIQISFYEYDGVFADDRDEVVMYPERIFGPTIVEQFDENPMEPDIVYVRYMPGACDYEITRVYDSYKRSILGQPD